MLKPEGYDSSDAVEGGFRKPLGPQILGVTGVMIQKNKDQQQQLVLQLDIAEGEFKNYYRKKGERDNKNRYLRFYQNTEGKSLPHFKGLVKAFEEGNNFTFSFNETELLRKKIGGVLREEEYQKNPDSDIIIVTKVAYLCSVRSIEAGEHKPLGLKKLSKNQPIGDMGFDPPPEEHYDQRPPEEQGFPTGPQTEEDLPF